MALQALTGVIYDITAHSWAVASIITKYYLFTSAVYLYQEKGLTREKFAEKLLNDSRIVLTGVIAAGTVLYILNFKPAPLLKIFSELAALAYLGFLFWKY